MINLNNHKYFYDPYPHALFEKVFDDRFYESLCKEFPLKQNYEKVDFDKQNKIKQNKFIINETHQSFKEILKNNKNIYDLYHHLRNKKFKDLILSLLEKNHISLPKTEDIFKKIYKKIKKIENFGFEFSMIPTDGGFIKPHTDGADKLISFVIPIVENDNLLKVTNSGTAILKPTEDKFKYNYLNMTVPFESTEVIRQIPFKRNQIFLFIKTHNSLHSVGPMINQTGEIIMRKSINFFIYK
jgi:hypothetical protein